jgi:hypothetical protein
VVKAKVFFRYLLGVFSGIIAGLLLVFGVFGHSTAGIIFSCLAGSIVAMTVADFSAVVRIFHEAVREVSSIRVGNRISGEKILSLFCERNAKIAIVGLFGLIRLSLFIACLVGSCLLAIFISSKVFCYDFSRLGRSSNLDDLMLLGIVCFFVIALCNWAIVWFEPYFKFPTRIFKSCSIKTLLNEEMLIARDNWRLFCRMPLYIARIAMMLIASVITAAVVVLLLFWAMLSMAWAEESKACLVISTIIGIIVGSFFRAHLPLAIAAGLLSGGTIFFLGYLSDRLQVFEKITVSSPIFLCRSLLGKVPYPKI